MRHTWVRATGGIVLVAGAALVFLLWPASLGGQVSYVTTHGVSMEPGISQGDLALVRRTTSYQPGQVAAYRSGTLRGAVVLHRIIGRDGDRFRFQGDNNDFVDGEEPTQEQLLGTLWLHVPKGGVLMQAFRTAAPWLSVASVVAGGAFRSRKRRRNRSQRRTPGHAAPRPARQSTTRLWRTVTLGAGGAAVACLALGALAFGQPSSTAATDVVRYAQRATFTYDAPAPVGPAYPSGRVESGDPVFLRLVDALDLTVDYRFESAAPHDVRGALAVKAVVSDATGWEHLVPLAWPTDFRGDTATAQVHLDLAHLQRLVQQVQDATGVKASGTKVAVVPMLRVQGAVDGQPIDKTFEPALTFSLDPLQLRTTGDGSSEDPLLHEEVAALNQPASESRHLEVPVLQQKVPVGAARGTAVLLGVPAVLVTGAGGLVLRRRLRGEVERIELRHGHRLVPVVGSPTSTHVVEVTSMQDLARLSEQLGSLILHRESGHGHDYLLQTEGVVYRYTAVTERALVPRLPVEL